MNPLQASLFKVISAIVGIDDFPSFGEQSAIRYGLLNYVAKFSLARDTYAITPSAKKLLLKERLLTAKGLRRGVKSSKLGFTYEHPIPANVIANEIVAVRLSVERMRAVLVKSDIVTIVTAHENELLGGRLKSRMPSGWCFADDPYARYVSAGIGDVKDFERVPVYGVISR